jgi:hypothetical protein
MKTFLRELYEIDPDLQAHESELIPLIEKLLSHDPSQVPNAAFVQSLRLQLQDRATSLSSSPSMSSSVWQKVLYAFGGAVTAAVVLPLVFIAWNKGLPPLGTSSSSTDLFGYRIEETSKGAFGELGAQQNGEAPTAPPVIRDQSGGGGPTNAVAPAMMGMGGGGMGMDAKMIAPYPFYEYDYVYEGKIADLKDSVAVYMRTPSAKNLSLSSLQSALNLGTLDISSFQGMNVDSVSFTQDRPYGYQLYVNLREATVNIDAMWSQWPQSQCTTDACFQKQRVKIGDIPSDDAVIKIAQDFAKEHGIDLSNYGTPEVNNQWRRDYDNTPNKADYYIPESLQVVFPLMIDDKPTYDQSGAKTGIAITVHIKENRVMSVWGIADRTYKKSDYTGVTDAAAIMKYIDNLGGGMFPIDARPMPLIAPDGNGESKKATVVLGDPTVSLVMNYRYENGKNSEILVPSLVFPVKEIRGGNGGYFYMNNVIVPLAKDLFDEQIPSAMPLEKATPAVDPRVM